MALSKFSQPELAYVSAIFAKADPQNKGLVTGDEAVKVLAGASLPPTTLGLIWTLADDENNGFLTRKGVAVLVRLVGWAQKGEQVSAALVDKRKLSCPGLRRLLVPFSTLLTRVSNPFSRTIADYYWP